MADELTIAQRWDAVVGRVTAAAERASRDPTEVTIVAVAKTFPADAVLAAIEAGATDVGENRAQELRDKMSALGDKARWHFVGPLQTNKARTVAGRVALIHSIDRYGLAEAIARRAANLGVTQDVLIEVNLAGEETKAGVEPVRAAALAEEIAALDGIRIRGLMAIPPVPDDPEETRAYFKELATVRDDVIERVPSATGLSMGMTHDFEVAIEEGATWIRVGEAIFGPRSAR